MKKFESITLEGVYFCLFHLALGLLCILNCIAESLVCSFLIHRQNDVQCVSYGIFGFMRCGEISIINKKKMK